jgi:hypothetical protein
MFSQDIDSLLNAFGGDVFHTFDFGGKDNIFLLLAFCYWLLANSQ